MTRMVYRALACAGLVGLFIGGSARAQVAGGANASGTRSAPERDQDKWGDRAARNWSNGGSERELAQQYPGSSLGGGTVFMPPLIMEGRVAQIDSSKESLRLSGGQELKLKSDTRVMMPNGARASINDIQQGDAVRASFAPGSSTEVQLLTILSPPPSTGSSSGSSPSQRPMGSSPSDSSGY